MPSSRYSMMLAGAVFLTGCSGVGTDKGVVPPPLGADFGNAVQHNAAVQIVDPMPGQMGAPALDGHRAAAAIVRYQNGAVRVLEIENTSDNKSN